MSVGKTLGMDRSAFFPLFMSVSGSQLPTGNTCCLWDLYVKLHRGSLSAGETSGCPELSSAGSGVRTPTVAPQESHLLQPSLSHIRKEILFSLSASLLGLFVQESKPRRYEKRGVIYRTPKILTRIIRIVQMRKLRHRTVM